MTKSLLLCVALLAGASGVAAAQSAPAATQTTQTDLSPQQTLKSAVERIQELIRKNHDAYKADPEQFYKVVTDVVVPHFDVPVIARLVLARYWRTATAAQRQAFQSSFTNMLVRSYADALLDNYNSAKVEWRPSRVAADATRARVDSVLVRDTGQKYPISFSMLRIGGQWKIYDIVVDNLSLALNFRSQITSEVGRIGLDAVITKMQHGNLLKKKESNG